MVYINEWLPNPVGPDATGEFVELYNSGLRVFPLAGWKIGGGALSSSTGAITPAKSPKPASLGGYSIPARGYLVLRHADTKLSLKNSFGALLLYGPDGGVADAAGFAGSAPEGMSFSRVSYDSSLAQHFAFLYPTAGGMNAAYDNAVVARRYSALVNLDPAPGPMAVVAAALFIAACTATLFIYAFKKNPNLSHLLFGGNETPR